MPAERMAVQTPWWRPQWKLVGAEKEEAEVKPEVSSSEEKQKAKIKVKGGKQEKKDQKSMKMVRRTSYATMAQAVNSKVALQTSQQALAISQPPAEPCGPTATKSLTREAAETQGAPRMKTACLSSKNGDYTHILGLRKMGPSLHLAGEEVFPNHMTIWGLA